MVYNDEDDVDDVDEKEENRDMGTDDNGDSEAVSLTYSFINPLEPEPRNASRMLLGTHHLSRGHAKLCDNKLRRTINP